jgi:hypothetical protein
MGDDPALYRTFILSGRLDRSRPSRPAGSRDPMVAVVAPFGTRYYVHKGCPPRGSTIAE